MMETNRSRGGRPRDSFVDTHVIPIEDHEGNVIAKKCIYCDHRFSTKTSVTRIKAHLGRVPGNDVALCRKVPSTVKEAATSAMPRSCTSSRPSGRMQDEPSTPNIPHHLGHTPTEQPYPDQNSEFCASTPHQPQHALVALQEVDNFLSSPQDAGNLWLDIFTNPDVRLSQFTNYDVSEDPQGLEPATNSLDHMSIGTQQTHQHQTSENFSLAPSQPGDLLTKVPEEVPGMPLSNPQPNESCSVPDLASQYPTPEHLGEYPSCLPYQAVQRDEVIINSVHDATGPQDFLQEGAYCNILPYSTHQEGMPTAEFNNHEGLQQQHHTQENQRISSLDDYPNVLPETLNVSACTSDQAKNEKKRKLLGKSSPIGKKLPLATPYQGPTFNKKVAEIHASLEGDFVSRIGVYGMGGSGKTTIMKYIYNQLLEERSMPFDDVIWVTVSQNHTITRLRRHLASRFNVTLPHDEDEVAQAASLYEGMQNKSYALILDDVWDKINLEEVGIPEPSVDNGCKLILTTRSLDVCKRMKCKPIYLDLLLEEEAWEFFVKTLDVAPQNSTVKCIMKDVAKECACLPLAIITIAGSMRGVFDVHEWRNALDSLRSRMYALTDMDKEVMEKLKFSYYRLSKQLQECLLVCALYPEDYRIDAKELISLLIFEGTISTASLLSANDHGYTMLNKLVNACLLTQNEFEEVVMHDLIRDMCLDIVGGRFLVKCCSEFPPDNSEYTEDVEKISLIWSEFREIPSHIVPYCPKLSTLILSENNNLARISSSFFTGLLSLQVLNLSCTSIHELPNSVTNLVNLNALVLQRCFKLRRLPCLASLKALNTLDLYWSKIEEAPEGLGELVHLTYLDLHGTKIRALPSLILRNLVKLQVLKIGRIEIMIDDVKELKNLEVFQATFAKLEEFNEYVSSVLNSRGGPHEYDVRVSYGLMEYGFSRDSMGVMGITLWGKKDDGGSNINCTTSMLPQDAEILVPSQELVEFLEINHLEEISRVFSELERVTSSSLHMLPIRLHHKEKTEESGQSKGLFDAKLLLVFPNLKILQVHDCENMEELISTSPSIGMFSSSLCFLCICKCDKSVRLLDPKFLSCFQNLETIHIGKCVNLESITSATNPMEKEECDNAISFPKLRRLILAELPNLKSICDGICPSIEIIHVRRCPKLKRLPLQLPVLDDNDGCGRLVPLQSSLKVICGERSWWESLEWDHPHAKTLLQPYFKPCLQRCYADYTFNLIS